MGLPQIDNNSVAINKAHSVINAMCHALRRDVRPNRAIAVALAENRMKIRSISSASRAISTPRYRSGSTMGKTVVTAANTAKAPHGFSIATISGLSGN